MNYTGHFARIAIFIALFAFLSLFYTCKKYPENADKKSEEIFFVDSLNAVYNERIYSEPDFIKQSIFENRGKIKDSLNYYKFINKLPFCYLYEHKIDSALLTARSIIAFCKKQDSGNEEISGLESLIYNSVAIIYKTTGQKESAIEYFQKAADIVRKTNDKTKLPDIYINLADYYYFEGDFTESVDYYRQALWLSDSLNLMDKNEFSIYIGLGQIYSNLKNYKVADFYYQKIENEFASLDMYTQYQFANNRGNYYYQTGDYEKALSWFQTANRVIKGYLTYEAITEANMAEIFLLLNQADSAKYYLDRAAIVFLAPESGLSEKFYTNGLYASISLAKNNLRKAEELLLAPYNEEEINPTYIYFNNKRLEELYAKKGDYKKAYEYKTKASVYNDSVINNATQNNIAEIEMRYRQDTTILKRDIIIAQREEKVAKLQILNTIVLSAGLIVLLLIVAFLLYYRRKKDLQYARQLAVITNLRMENIRNRISPHFMFNILNAVLPALRQHEEWTKPLQLLVQSIRNNLIVSEKMAVPLKDELNMVQNFIDLRKSIGSENAEVIWTIDEDVDLNILVPSICMQIPVENALKYAFEEYKKENRLFIKITKKREESISTVEEFISIIIEDNGIGLEKANIFGNTKGTGNGLKILYKTIELLNVKNVQKIAFNIRDKRVENPDETGTIVSIVIPVNYQYKI